MEKVTKEFISEHYLGNDIVIDIDIPSGQTTITSYVKNTGRRRFERIKLNAIQSIALKNMLNENY